MRPYMMTASNRDVFAEFFRGHCMRPHMITASDRDVFAEAFR